MIIDSSPIGELLADCRAAFTSAATSAAVDAYCAGVPVISLSNLNELNLSPLRGLSEVTFINTAEELAIQLDKLILLDTKRCPSEKIFNLDTELTLWKKILQ
jgi:surface carbohydrate biosynthesis protein (TIGR04326 family)